MTESENEKIVEKIFEAINSQDWDAMMNHYADDMTVVWDEGTIADKEQERKSLEWATDAFAPFRTRVDRMISQGNTVVVEWTNTATHKSELFGIPATNKRYEISGVFIIDFEDGKVKLLKYYWNQRKLEQFLRE